MNTKVSNIIAVELGIVIVILAWLAFSNFFRIKQPTPAEEQEPADSSFATVSSFPRPATLRRSAADYFTDQQRQQLAAQRQVQTLQYETTQYDQQLAPAPDANGYADDSVTTGTSPYYAGAYPQPETSPDSFAWPYDPVLVYPPTSEIIVISNGQAFVRRIAPRFARPRTMVVHRRLPGGGGAQFQPRNHAFALHPRGGGVIPRRTANPRSFPQSAGLRSR
jgi:type II secretory pathway pseudopilin PulG